MLTGFISIAYRICQPINFQISFSDFMLSSLLKAIFEHFFILFSFPSISLSCFYLNCVTQPKWFFLLRCGLPSTHMDLPIFLRELLSELWRHFSPSFHKSLSTTCFILNNFYINIFYDIVPQVLGCPCPSPRSHSKHLLSVMFFNSLLSTPLKKGIICALLTQD